MVTSKDKESAQEQSILIGCTWLIIAKFFTFLARFANLMLLRDSGYDCGDEERIEGRRRGDKKEDKEEEEEGENRGKKRIGI